MENLKASLVLAVGYFLLYAAVGKDDQGNVGGYALSPWKAWAA